MQVKQCSRVQPLNKVTQPVENGRDTVNDCLEPQEKAIDHFQSSWLCFSRGASEHGLPSSFNEPGWICVPQSGGQCQGPRLGHELKIYNLHLWPRSIPAYGHDRSVVGYTGSEFGRRLHYFIGIQ